MNLNYARVQKGHPWSFSLNKNDSWVMQSSVVYIGNKKVEGHFVLMTFERTQ